MSNTPPFPPWYKRLSFYSILLSVASTVVFVGFLAGHLDAQISSNRDLIDRNTVSVERAAGHRVRIFNELNGIHTELKELNNAVGETRGIAKTLLERSKP
jgi:hypothetical protein